MIILVIILCGTALSYTPTRFLLNQLGYAPTSPKHIAIANPKSTSVDLYYNGSFLQTLSAGPAQLWEESGDTIRVVDVSHISNTGFYYLRQGPDRSHDFALSSTPYDSLLRGLIKFFYYQRSSTPILAQYGGVWSRDAGPRTGYDYASMTDVSGEYGGREFPGGWFDGYDYSKYMPSTLFSIMNMLSALQDFPEIFESQSLNIPESGNGVPDVLNEIRWGLDWAMRMQSPLDGGAYHRMTPHRFPLEKMPQDDDANRFVVNKTVTASFALAAALAQASALFRPFDPSYADTCLSRAEAAYQWGLQNPTAYASPNLGNYRTKEYLDSSSSDEFFQASVQLALATQGSNPVYSNHATANLGDLSLPSWKNINALGCFSAVVKSTVIPQIAQLCSVKILHLADSLLHKAAGNGLGIAMSAVDYSRESNAVLLGSGKVLLYAYLITNNENYLDIAQNHLDYLLGRNALGTSFVTGFTQHYPANPAHPISAADGVVTPVPGAVVSGPNSSLTDVPASCLTSYATGFPASTWYDNFCSYSTNEVGIHLNAAALYLSAGLVSIAAGHTPDVPVFSRMSRGKPRNFMGKQRHGTDLLGRAARRL